MCFVDACNPSDYKSVKNKQSIYTLMDKQRLKKMYAK